MKSEINHFYFSKPALTLTLSYTFIYANDKLKLISCTCYNIGVGLREMIFMIGATVAVCHII
jgi:hypothetical protein